MGNKISKLIHPSPPPPPPPPPEVTQRTYVKPVHQDIEDILNEADSPIDKSSPDKLYDQLYSGVLLAQKTKKFWVHKKLNCNCFMLYARSLSVIWSDHKRYWTWVSLEESWGATIEGASLKEVCWLDVKGTIDTRKLTAGVMYGVSFHVMFQNQVAGWYLPVYLKLELPGGGRKTIQERPMNFSNMLRGTWMEIPVGQFVAPTHDKGGEMVFTLYEHGDHWKRGLLLKGASITPL